MESIGGGEVEVNKHTFPHCFWRKEARSLRIHMYVYRGCIAYLRVSSFSISSPYKDDRGLNVLYKKQTSYSDSCDFA